MIKSLGLALASLVMFATAPLAAHAAAPAADAPKIDLTIDKDHHTQGQREAPAVVARANMQCQVTDAYYLGSSQSKGADGKDVETKLYEVACQNGLGQVLQAPPTGPVNHFDCIAVQSTPNIRCRLPANADPKVAIAGWAKTAGQTCSISDIRGLGSNPAGDTFYEVACSDKLGFVLQRKADGSVSANDCALLIGTPAECKLTTADQIKAVDRKTIETLAAASGKTCAIKDTRTIGKLNGGGAAYEIACQAGDGYVLVAKDDGGLKTTVPCANADSIAGGCKLTDATVAQTQEAGTYTKLSSAAGFPCKVSKYRFIGMDTKSNSEVVELACSDHPDGGIAVFPADNSRGHVYDCIRAGYLGQQCHLSDPNLMNSKYTQLLASRGKTTCKVSGAHYLGHATDGSDYIETACSDGLPGWVVVVSPTGQATDTLSCGQAKASSVSCTLPTNLKK